MLPLVLGGIQGCIQRRFHEMITSDHRLTFRFQLVPDPSRHVIQLNQGHATVVADERQGVDLEWTVGGAFEVDTTQVG